MQVMTQVCAFTMMLSAIDVFPGPVCLVSHMLGDMLGLSRLMVSSPLGTPF